LTDRASIATLSVMHRADRLQVTHRAHELAIAVYQTTTGFPPGERFGLTAQLRRAAVSVGSNIAEGSALGTDGGFVRHLYIARGSVSEVRYQIQLAADLGYATSASAVLIDKMCSELSRMLTALIARLDPSHGVSRPQPPRGDSSSEP